jgi:hypothetical protein
MNNYEAPYTGQHTELSLEYPLLYPYIAIEHATGVRVLRREDIKRIDAPLPPSQLKDFPYRVIINGGEQSLLVSAQEFSIFIDQLTGRVLVSQIEKDK